MWHWPQKQSFQSANIFNPSSASYFQLEHYSIPFYPWAADILANLHPNLSYDWAWLSSAPACLFYLNNKQKKYSYMMYDTSNNFEFNNNITLTFTLTILGGRPWDWVGGGKKISFKTHSAPATVELWVGTEHCTIFSWVVIVLLQILYIQ